MRQCARTLTRSDLALTTDAVYTFRVRVGQLNQNLTFFFEIWQCAEMQLRPAKQLARNGSIVCGRAKHLTFQLTTIWQWTNKKQKLKSQFGIRARGSSVDWGAAAGARLVEEQTGGGTKRIDGLWLPLVYPPLLLLFSCPFYLRYLGYLSYLIYSS